MAAELMSGTFYLLMLAIGALAAALAAHLGAGLTTQLVTAAVVGGLAVVLWRQKACVARRKAPPSCTWTSEKPCK